MTSVSDRRIERERAANLWEPFARKFPPVAKACDFRAGPTIDFEHIGGLEEAKDELLTYACAATDPEVYQRWGTLKPSGVLLIGPSGSGKTLLAEALAFQTETPFLAVNVPKLVLQILHSGGKAGDTMQGWLQTLGEIGHVTVFFDELDFGREFSARQPRPDIPVGPIGDFLVEMIDDTLALDLPLVCASTSRPDQLSPIYMERGRFERIVAVHPTVPGDVIEALEIHAAAAEQRAGGTLFEDVNWPRIVEKNRSASIGEWVRLLHAVLRRKARCDAAEEKPGPVLTQDFLNEVDRFKRVSRRLTARPGSYL